MEKLAWVEKVINDTVQGKQYKRRIQSGIDHIAGKKLYKYYSLSSEHTITNLENNLIYLQNPVLFNDPFDCNIGISVNQLIRAIIPNLFDKLMPDTSENVKDVLLHWLLTDTIPDFGTEAKERLLTLCINSPSFMRIVEEAKNGEEVSDEKLLSVFLEESDTATEVIKEYLKIVANGEPLQFDNTIIQHVIQSPQILHGMIKNLSSLEGSKEKQLLEILTTKDDFFAKATAIASSMGMNVPQSEIEKIYEKLDDGIKQIREGFGKQVGVECFTQSPTDILMWSYYANKHTGICVEYDFSKLFTTLPNAFLFPVHYSEKRPVLDIQTIYNPTTKVVDEDALRHEFPNIIWSWITKSLEWEREKEWRLIVFPIKDDESRLAKLPIVSRIITGINITEENYEAIAKIAKEKQIPIHRTRLKNDQYKIEILGDESM